MAVSNPTNRWNRGYPRTRLQERGLQSGNDGQVRPVDVCNGPTLIGAIVFQEIQTVFRE
jgi:hypothetical protein